jgi:hypothetical protein
VYMYIIVVLQKKSRIVGLQQLFILSPFINEAQKCGDSGSCITITQMTLSTLRAFHRAGAGATSSASVAPAPFCGKVNACNVGRGAV